MLFMKSLRERALIRKTPMNVNILSISCRLRRTDIFERFRMNIAAKGRARTFYIKKKPAVENYTGCLQSQEK